MAKLEGMLHIIAAMCKQERDGYTTDDYLHQEQPSLPAFDVPTNACSQSHGSSSGRDGGCGSSSGGGVSLDTRTSGSGTMMRSLNVEAAENRTKMATWCYRVVDFCKFQRETAAIAMNILDRYMSQQLRRPTGTHLDRRTYQLAVMTCLYTSVKIHEPEAMDPNMVSTLSRDVYSAHDVEVMELQILQAVSWRVNPPTAMSFVRQCLDLLAEQYPELGLELEDDAKTGTYHMLTDLCQVQTELAVSDYNFLTVRPSLIAYSSLINALLTLSLDDYMLQNIGTFLAQTLQLDPNSLYNIQVQISLCEQAFAPKRGSVPWSPTSSMASLGDASMKMHQFQRQDSGEISPRSVSATTFL